MDLQERFSDLRDAGARAMDAADYRALRTAGRDLNELGEANGDALIVAWGEYFGGVALIYNNEGGAANRSLRRALNVFRERGERVMAARTMINLAMIESDINLDGSAARRLLEEAAPAIREEGDLKRLAILFGNLGEICRLEGDYDAALRHARESERLFREAGDSGRLVWQLVDIAHYLSLRREYAAAIESLHAAFAELSREFRPRWVAWYFDVWVIIAAKLERWETAARLLGFVDRWRSEQNVPRLQLMLPSLSVPIERMGSIIAQDRLHELFLEGEELTIEGAQALTTGVRVEPV
jgi:tetratricopeptide (TPR) repeat protein